LLPSTVVNQVAKARAAELEEQQGFAPGKKAMKELKERVHDELLPRAFTIRTNTWCWIDPVNGWLVVDAASAAKAEDVLKMLLKAIERMPVESVRVARSPTAVMTAWLQDDEAPAGFTVDMDATMQATGESKAAVVYKRHTLEPEEVRRHIAAGKQCKRLAMTWESKISFVLDESLSLKSIKPLDVMKENDAVARNADERFDSDFALMTGELARMFDDLMEALGGEANDLVSPARERTTSNKSVEDAARGLDQMLKASGASATLSVNGEVQAQFGAQFGPDGIDLLYEQAVQVVLKHRMASISLVQRHLRIGYNRAGRLLEAMEQGGVVGPMQSNGHRDILLGAEA
ncbi:MAG: recombination-associated protein RdgC, partial [Pseudoduganella sp.]|nr:recombination-associated protein RdgC [Pseudoduganella sp.]